MQRRHRHLRRPDEHEVVAVVAAVRLLLPAGEVARPHHGLAAHERRHGQRDEALADHQVERETHRRALEEREIAAQDVVARTREPRRAVDLEPALCFGERHVVERLEVEAPRLTLALHLDVLRVVLAFGNLGGGQVRHAQEEVRELLPNVVAVYLEGSTPAASVVSREGMQPRDLLASYFEQARVQDEAALKLFDELVEEDHASAPA